MNNELNDHVKNKNYIGYIITGSAIIIAALWGLYLLVRSEGRTDDKSADERIAALHIYYQNREDKKDSLHQIQIYQISNRYQLVLDRERETNLKTIEELKKGVNKIDSNSQINGRLAKINETKSKRNVKILNEAHKQISQ